MSPEKSSPEVPFQEPLRLIPGPVTVVGVAGDQQLGGLTAAWVTRVSHDPPLLMVAVGHERHSWRLLRDAGQFTISLLADGQVPEARLFGLHSRRDRDKWAEVDHVLLGNGVPALRRCSARFLCQVEDRFTTGDHDCVVGRVLEAETVVGQPVLPLRGSDYVP